MANRSQKIKIGKYLRRRYSCRRVKYEAAPYGEAVSCYVDKMPNTNRAGRIFVGSVTELLVAASRRK